MSVIITFMFEPAKLQMNCASASGAISLRMVARDRSPVEGGLTDTDRSVTDSAVSQSGRRAGQHHPEEMRWRQRNRAPRKVPALTAEPQAAQCRLGQCSGMSYP